MSANQKDWKWCKYCRHWVFTFPLGVGQMCDHCWLELIEYDKNKTEARQAATYLERDYCAAGML